MARKKGVDLFCASQASTAICMSMEQKSIIQPGSRAIDRHNPHLREVRRSRSYSQSSSQPSSKISTTQPYHQKSRKSTSSKPNNNTLLSPSGSSRYLLTNTPYFNVLDSFSAIVPVEKEKPSSINSADQSTTAVKPSSKIKPDSQVVVLRVSLHCRGCEGKVRKHISRMEGVTSFSIDFPTKKVTVVGDVTPLSVLASVSRVKNAQLWPTTTTPPSVSVGSDKLIYCQKS